MLEDVWNNIILLNLKDFENIGIDFYINIFLFFVSLAIIIYALAFEYSRGVMHTVVKQLIRHGAFDKDGGMTISELGISDGFFTKFMLSRDPRLARIVHRVGEPDISHDEYMKLKRSEREKLLRVDFSTERFYIPEDKKDAAERVFATYAFSLPRFLVFCLFVFLIWGAVAAVSYELFNYLNSIIIRQ